jgi:hypothetical protein
MLLLARKYGHIDALIYVSGIQALVVQSTIESEPKNILHS